MGTATGTPSGDIRAAIRPDLSEIPEPEKIAQTVITKDALVDAPVIASKTDFRRPMRIGVEAELGDTLYASWVRYTLEELRHVFGKKNVRVFYLDGRGLTLALQNGEIDFFVSNAHTFALQQAKGGVEQMASFLPVDAARAEDAQAGVLFMRRSTLEQIERTGFPLPQKKKPATSEEIAEANGTDALSSASRRLPERPEPIGVREGTSGKEGALLPVANSALRLQRAVDTLGSAPIAAVTPTSFGGWYAPLAELTRAGLTQTAALEQTIFTQGDARAVLSAVLNGTARIGILPACSLERFQMAGDVDIGRDLVILNAQRNPSLRCVASTPTYPGWAFGTTSRTDPVWKKNVGALLFAMNAERYGGEWQYPALNRSVYDLFYELKMGPYEHLATWSFHRFMRENSEALALIIFLTFVVVSYAVSLSVMVRRKTKALRDALRERDLVEAEAAQSRQHIANLERTGIVGQMSTIIAHELKQPLSAITNYANGLQRRTNKDQFEKESFLWALHEIANEAERASRIVNRVRSYAKHDYPPRTVTDLSVVIGNSITTFRRSRQTDAEIVVRVSPGSMAEVDAWEIELAVLNLLKNAADAISGVSNPRIEVSLLATDAKTWSLSVADNGPYVSDERLALFFKPLQTTKGASGMGLGLSIVANIAERHAGHITVARNGASGVRFTMTFPRPVSEGEAPETLPPEPQPTVWGGRKEPSERMLPTSVAASGLIEAQKGPAHDDQEGRPVTIHSKGLTNVLDRMG